MGGAATHHRMASFTRYYCVDGVNTTEDTIRADLGKLIMECGGVVP